MSCSDFLLLVWHLPCFEPFDIVIWHQPNWLAKILQIIFKTAVSIGSNRSHNTEYEMPDEFSHENWSAYKNATYRRDSHQIFLLS